MLLMLLMLLLLLSERGVGCFGPVAKQEGDKDGSWWWCSDREMVQNNTHGCTLKEEETKGMPPLLLCKRRMSLSSPTPIGSLVFRQRAPLIVANLELMRGGQTTADAIILREHLQTWPAFAAATPPPRPSSTCSNSCCCCCTRRIREQQLLHSLLVERVNYPCVLLTLLVVALSLPLSEIRETPIVDQTALCSLTARHEKRKRSLHLVANSTSQSWTLFKVDFRPFPAEGE